MSEPESFEDLPALLESAKVEALARIETHRASCPLFSENRGCDQCQRWFCACGAEAVAGAGYSARCKECDEASSRRAEFTGARNTIPPRWQGICLLSPELPAYVTGYEAQQDRVWELMESQQPVILRGPSGVGKTTLACAMMNQLMFYGALPGTTTAERNRARKSLFTTEFDLFKASKQCKPWEEPGLVRRAMEASVLVLDDLGQRPDEKAAVVAELVDHRYSHTLPTWVTTFLTSADMIALYGAGTHRRLCEARQFILLGEQGTR